MWNTIKSNYLQLAALALSAIGLLWVYGCLPRVRSPIDPTKKVTRAELHILFETTIATFEEADLSLEEKEQIQRFIVENVLTMAQTGSINPLGVITALGGVYGLTRASKDGISLIQRRRQQPPTT